MLASRQRNWSSYICWCDCKMVQLLWKMAISYKIKHTFSARNSWALYGREIKTYVHIKKKTKKPVHDYSSSFTGNCQKLETTEIVWLRTTGNR